MYKGRADAAATLLSQTQVNRSRALPKR